MVGFASDRGVGKHASILDKRGLYNAWPSLWNSSQWTVACWANLDKNQLSSYSATLIEGPTTCHNYLQYVIGIWTSKKIKIPCGKMEEEGETDFQISD